MFLTMFKPKENDKFTQGAFNVVIRCYNFSKQNMLVKQFGTQDHLCYSSNIYLSVDSSHTLAEQ